MFIQTSYHQQTPRHAPLPVGPRESCFEMHQRISPVVLLTGTPRARLSVFETVDAGKLMRELSRCAIDGVRIRGMLCELGALTPRSRNTLNCFLRNGGLRLFQKSQGGGSVMHRFAWYELQRYLGLRWER